MQVQRVLSPVTGLESWTVLGNDGPIQPIETYLAYLTDIERSPNTIKAYAHDLKDYFTFLGLRGWTGVRCALRTWASSWPGCAARRACARGTSRCCPRWSITALRRR